MISFMKKAGGRFCGIWTFFALIFSPMVLAAEPVESVHLNVMILTASNQGSDFDLVNDQYRDQLIKLFSYRSYHQIKAVSEELTKAGHEKIDLPEGYELILILQGHEDNRVQVQAIIRKGGIEYVDTVLSIMQPGVVFVGGPPIQNGNLIIVLETGF